MNGDGVVDLQDLRAVVAARGSRPGDPAWNPNADVNGDGQIDLKDLVVVARHFGARRNRPPLVKSFEVMPASGPAPVKVVFQWSLSDPDGDTLVCNLDVDGDSTSEYTLEKCALSGSLEHIYGKKGDYTARLTVSDGREAASATAKVEVEGSVPATLRVQGLGPGEAFTLGWATTEGEEGQANVGSAGLTLPPLNPSSGLRLRVERSPEGKQCFFPDRVSREWFLYVGIAPVEVRVACMPTPRLPEFVVDPNLEPTRDTIPGVDGGAPRPVAVLSHNGQRVELVENELLVATNDGEALAALLARWNGEVLHRIPFGKLGPLAQDLYLVRVSPGPVDTSRLGSLWQALHPTATGTLAVSSEQALRLLYVVAEEGNRGLTVAFNPVIEVATHLVDPNRRQILEDPNLPTPNVYDWPYMHGALPQNINVLGAWWLMEEAGALRNDILGVNVSVFDQGLRSPTADRNPADYPDDDDGTDLSITNADVPGTIDCSGGAPCPWHGTMVAAVLAAVPNNGVNVAGPASPVLNRFSLYAWSSSSLWDLARYFAGALAELGRATLGGSPLFKPNIVNMSGGERIPASVAAPLNALLDPIGAYARIVGVLPFAAAMNDGEDVDAEDCAGICWEEATWIPCETSGVVCVGGVAWAATGIHPNSNYGSKGGEVHPVLRAVLDVVAVLVPGIGSSLLSGPLGTVDLYGPYTVYAPQLDASGNPASPPVGRIGGTSFASPFVAGVGALVWRGLYANDALVPLVLSPVPFNPVGFLLDDVVEAVLYTTAHKVAGRLHVTHQPLVNACGAVARVLPLDERVEENRCRPLEVGFRAHPDSGWYPLTTTFSWSISGPEGFPYPCTLDVDDDGTPEYTFDDCRAVTSQDHTYRQRGDYTARLTVEGPTARVSRTVSVRVTVPTWMKSYGAFGDDGWVRTIRPLPDGGYILAAKTRSEELAGPGRVALWLLRLDRAGNILWQRTYRSPGERFYHLDALDLTDDNGFVLVGTAKTSDDQPYTDIRVMKLDAAGNPQWVKAYGGPYDEKGADILQTPDGGFLVLGQTNSYGQTPVRTTRLWLLRLDSAGEVVWQKVFVGEAATGITAREVHRTPGGDYLVLADTAQPATPYRDLWVLRVNDRGGVLWQRTYGLDRGSLSTQPPSSFQGPSLSPTPDDGAVVVATVDWFPTRDRTDLLALKLDRDGNVQWAYRASNTESPAIPDYGAAVEVAPDGTIYLVGTTMGDAWVQQLTPTGPTEGRTWGVAVAGSYVYVADGRALRVADISDPDRPRQVARLRLSGEPWDVAVLGDYAFVASGEAGLQVVDVSDPRSPRVVASYATPAYAQGISVWRDGGRDYLLFSLGDGSLQVVDVSDPLHPVLADWAAVARVWGTVDVFVSGDYAFVADGEKGLRVVDVSDPANPREVGAYDTPGRARGVFVSGNYAYVADRDAVRVVDVSDPANPREVGAYNTRRSANSVFISGNLAFVAEDSFSDQWDWGLLVLDISDPRNPRKVGEYRTPGYALHVFVSGNYTYVADDLGGLRVVDVSDPANPRPVGVLPPAREGTVEDAAVAGASPTGPVASLVAAMGRRGVRALRTEVSVGTTMGVLEDTPGFAQAVSVQGNNVFVADGPEGLRVISMRGFNEVSSYDTPGNAAALAVSGQHVYLLDKGSGVWVLDVSDLGNIHDVAFVRGDLHGLALEGNYLYLAGWGHLQVVDISTPSAPVVRATLRWGDLVRWQWVYGARPGEVRGATNSWELGHVGSPTQDGLVLAGETGSWVAPSATPGYADPRNVLVVKTDDQGLVASCRWVRRPPVGTEMGWASGDPLFDAWVVLEAGTTAQDTDATPTTMPVTVQDTSIEPITICSGKP